MASTIVEFPYYTGRTLTSSIFPLGSDTADQSSMSATEQANRKGVYRITVTAASTGVCTVVVFEGGVSVAVYPTESLADTTATFQANDSQVNVALIQSGLATSTEVAANLTAIGGIGSTGGAALPVEATSDNAGGAIIDSVTILGTEAGTYASTEADDASYHVITGTATALDWVYGFSLGGGYVASAIEWKGYVNSNNDDITVQAWNGSTWDTRFVIAGVTGSNDQLETITLLAKHTTTAGLVYIRFVTSGDTNPELHTNVLSVLKVNTSRTVGYASGEVWIDTVSGVAGTESFVNGVADNPVLTLADALTIATANKLTNFNVANGNTITLASTTSNKRFEGHEWILALGGQDISGTNFEGANAITGTSSGTTDVQFEDCVIGNGSTGATLPPGTYIRCGFNTGSGFVFTGSAAGRYVFVDCYSNIAVGGASTPYFTFTGASAVMFRRYSGGANITFDAATAALTYECLGGGNLTVALAGSDLQARGTIRDITLTGITTASLVEFVGTTGNLSLAGADGTVTLDGIVGAVVDSRTGAPVLNRPVNTMGIVGDITGTLETLTTYTGNTVQTGDSFARIGVAGAGLTNIDLPNQTMDIVGSITGSLSGSVGSVAGNVDGNVTGSVGSVVTKTGYSLAATGLDSITATTPAGLATTFPQKMMQLWARFFNRVAKGSLTMTNYADDGTTPTVTQTYTTSGTDTTDDVGGAS